MKANTASSPSVSFTSAYEAAVQTVGFLSIDAVEKAQSGHPGAPLGQATLAVELFTQHLIYSATDPEWPNRDRFVLSCGHASMLLYSVLHLAGYDLTLEDLKDFRQWGAKTAGHPEYGEAPGVETTTGPLGQGVGNAVGMALASKMAAAQLGEPGLIDYRVYGLCSDGDLMEGVAYEAMSLAGQLGLDNLVLIYDDNRITIDGPAALSFSEDVQARALGMGWHAERVDGHDGAAVRAALVAARKAGRPALILARTEIGRGSPGKHGSSASHGSPLGAAEVVATKKAAGWPLEPTFFVPDEAYRAFDEQAARNQAVYQAWQAKVAALSTDKQLALNALLQRPVPADLLLQLAEAAGTALDATRGHAGRLQQLVAKLCPALVGGSADLAGSVKTTIKGSAHIGPGQFLGRNFNFGIREHGMGAVMNGLALSGLFTPFGSTFLIFSDYMRPPMRLAGLMRQQAIYVFSHDSVFLGEDGPTHQPVEQLWTMRMVPNLDVYRPADALECAAAWAYAMQRKDGPTALSLTRHEVPALTRPADFELKWMLDGAYVLSDVEAPELVLIATGSEVCVAVEVQKLLGAKGKRARVVSMPCVTAFLRLPQARKEQILPPGIRRASLELGVTLPWKAITGLDGICIGVDRFGASAPWQELQKHFEVDAESVARRILAEL